MKHRVLNLLLCISFISFNLKGQDTGYFDGYIITNQNDTLKGFVKNKNFTPYRVLQEIKFRRNEDSKVETFSPNDLVGFKIGTHNYISKNTTAVDGLNDRFFLEIVISGYLSYYELEHTNIGVGNVNKYLILQRQDEREQFTYMVNSLTNFKKSIVEYLKDAPDICDKINNGIYKNDDVYIIVEQFNKFKEGVPYKYYVPTPMYFYHSKPNISVTYRFQIVTKNDSIFTTKTQINVDDKQHSITVEGKGLKRTLFPKDTKSLTRISDDGIRLFGIPSDSCWLFRTNKGKINCYSFVAEPKRQCIIAIQNGTGPIVPLTKENLSSMVGNDPKINNMIEEENYIRAIEMYNAR